MLGESTKFMNYRSENEHNDDDDKNFTTSMKSNRLNSQNMCRVFSSSFKILETVVIILSYESALTEVGQVLNDSFEEKNEKYFFVTCPTFASYGKNLIYFLLAKSIGELGPSYIVHSYTSKNKL